MITIQDIHGLITEESAKLQTIGIIHVPIEEVLLTNSISFYADACLHLGRIRVSKYYLSAPVEEIIGTIMHELLHMVSGTGRGHGKAWKDLASKVNKAFPQYNIKRVGTQLSNGKSFSLRVSAIRSKATPTHKVVCLECGQKFVRTRESRLTLHPEYYKCTCGGKLHRVY